MNFFVIKLNIWMSSGGVDIYLIIVHILTNNLHHSHVRILMVKTVGIYASSIPIVMIALVIKSNPIDYVIYQAVYGVSNIIKMSI